MSERVHIRTRYRPQPSVLRPLPEAPERVSIEAECRDCGDWVMVPGDEDPENTLCAPCADARDGGEE